MLIEGEQEIYKWKSLTLTNYRVIKKRGAFWKHYWDINYDHLSSVYTGRRPLWSRILIGFILTILCWNFLGVENIPEEIKGLFGFGLFVGIIMLIVGIIGLQKTIILGCNGKIEENGMSLEFMKKINECRLKYLGKG